MEFKMQFVVIAYDGTDEGALERRMAAREAHLKSAKELFEEGKWLYAVGILNDEGKPIGSMIVCDFASRDELEQQWLNDEPYVVGNVWKEIKINRAQGAPFNPGKK
jgi:uncharacterized protein YciI